MPYNVGDAYLRIIPVFEGIALKINAEAKKWGTTAGRSFSQSFNDQVKHGTANANLGPGVASATRQGSSQGGAFARGFRTRVEAAMRALPEIELRADSSDVDREIWAIRARLAFLSEATIGIDIDEKEALAEIAEIQAALLALRTNTPSINVDVDATEAMAQLAAIQAQVAAVNAVDIDIPVADTQIDRYASKIGAITGAIMALAAVAGPAGGALSALLAAGATTAGAVGGGAVVGGVGLLGIKDAYDLLIDRQKAVAKGDADMVRQIDADLSQLSSAVVGVARKVDTDLRGAFDGLKQSAAEAIAPGVSNLIDGVTRSLPRLEHAVSVVGDAVGDLLTRLGDGLSGPGWNGFLDFVADITGPVLSQFGSILGNLGEGFVGLLRAFEPTTMTIGQAIEDWTVKFREFATGSGIDQFIEYVRLVGPEVASLFGSAVDAAMRLMEVLTPLGLAVINMVDGLLSFMASLNAGGLSAMFTAIGVAASMFGSAVLRASGIAVAFAGIANIVAANWDSIGPVVQPLVDLLGLLAKGIGALLDLFGMLPGAIQAAIAGFVAFKLVAATGMFTSISGAAASLVAQLRLIKSEGLAASGALGKVGGFLGKTGAFVGGALLVGEIASAFSDAASNAREFQFAVDELQQSLIANGGVWDDTMQSAREMSVIQSDVFKELIANGADYGETLRILTGDVADGAVASESFKKALQGLPMSLTQQAFGMMEVRKSAEEAAAAFLDNEQSAKSMLDSWQRNAPPAASAITAAMQAVIDGGRSFRDYSDAAKLEARAVRGEWAQVEADVTDSLDGIANALGSQVDSMVSLHGAADDLGSAFADFKGSLTGVNGELNLSSGSVRDLVADMRAYGDAAQDAAAATYDQTGSLDAAAAVAAQARDEFIALMMSQGDTRAEAERLATQMGILDSITIDGKVFTITAIDQASGVLSRIVQLASMLGINTKSAGLSAGAAMSDWLRKNPDQLGAAFQEAVKKSMNLDFTAYDTPGSSGGGGGGGGGGGRSASAVKSAAEKAAEKAAKVVKKAFDKVGKPIQEPFDLAEVGAKRVNRQIDAAEKALTKFADDLTPKQVAKMERQIAKWRQAVIDQTAEIAADKAEAKSEQLFKKVQDVMSGIGKTAAAPFDITSAGADTIAGQIADAGVRLQKAVKKGLDKGQAKELRDELVGMAGEFGRQLRAVFDQIRTEDFAALDDAVNPITGSVSAMSSAMGQLRKNLTTIGASSSSLDKLSTIEGRITHTMDQRAAVMAELVDRQSELNGLMQQYEQRVDSVTRAIQSYGNITSVQATNSIGWVSSVGDLAAQLGQRADEIDVFASNIDKLRAMGLNETSLNEIIDAGVSGGGAYAQLLASATAEEVRKLNDLQSRIFGAGNRVGKMSADTMYSAGIEAVKAQIRGLESERDTLQTTIENLVGEAKFLAESEMETQGLNAVKGIVVGIESGESIATKAMKRLGKQMVAALKAELEIASPSKVMAREVGKPMADGVLDGFTTRFDAPIFAKSMRGVAVPSIANMAIPTAASGGGVSRVELVLRGDGAVTDAMARVADVRITDAQGRQVQVDRMTTFEAAR